jgi:hypothetical protein
MANPDDTSSDQSPSNLPAPQGAAGGQFAIACDWGENWGRIALTDATSGAEILVVVPFSGGRDLSAAELERQVCEQARPHLNKAVRTLIAKTWAE